MREKAVWKLPCPYAGTFDDTLDALFWGGLASPLAISLVLSQIILTARGDSSVSVRV